MDKYHYTECGLSNVFLRNGFEVSEFEGEECYAVHDTEALHKAIGLEILNKTTLLNGEEIRFLRKECGLSQKDLADILGVKDQSVANYEKEVTKQLKSSDLIIRLQYAAHIQSEANVTSLQKILSLDATDRSEVDFSEKEGQWASSALAA